MTRHGHRLLGVLGLFLLVACDDGGSKTEAKKAAAPPAKTSTSKPNAKADAKDAASPEAPKVAAATPTPPAAPTPEVAPPTDPPPAADGGEAPPAEPVDDTAAPEELVPEEPVADEGGETEGDEGAAKVATEAEVNGVTLDDDAELLRLVLAHDVENRQPVDPATSFPAGHKVNLFVEARNESGAEQSVRVTWETVGSGRRSPPTTVRIPTRKLHRTRAYRTVKRPGEYRCIVLGEDDSELAVIPFTITG